MKQKRFNRFLVLLLGLLTMCVTQVWGDSYTITFKTGSNDGTSVSTSTECSDIVTAGSNYLSGNLATATNVYNAGGSGLKLGTGSNSGTLKMNLSSSGEVSATTVIVRAKQYNSSKPTKIALNGKTAQSLSADFADYTFTINSDITYLELVSSKGTSGGAYCWIESITVNYSSNSPSITKSGTLSTFTATYGSYSTEQTFQVGGSKLTADITITAPANFEISKTTGAGFGSSVTLTKDGSGNVDNTTLYVRLKDNIAAGTVSAANITCESTGANTQNISVSGKVQSKINWSVNGSAAAGSPTGAVDKGNKVTTLPTAPTSAACDGSKVFVGWTDAPIASPTNTKPSTLFTAASGAPAINVNEVTYYAVFATASAGGSNSLSYGWEETMISSDWEKDNLSNGSSYNTYKHLGSYAGSTGSATTAYIKTKDKIASPTSATCFYTKASSNNNSSSKFIIQVSTNGTNWTDVSTGKTMNNVTQGTFEELTADLSSYSNVYVRFYYTGTSATRVLDDVSIVYGGGTTYTDYITECVAQPEYAVTFANGGKGTLKNEDGDYSAVTLKKMEDVTGYEHTGWTANATIKVGGEMVAAGTTIAADATATISEPTAFTTVWTHKNYNITYTLNGGAWNGDAGAATYTYGTGIATLADNVQRDGYNFDGWYAASDFSGDRVTSIADNATDAKTFYAKWSAASYGITYNLNDGEWNGAEGVGTYTFGAGVATLATNLQKENHRFGGWYDNEDLTGTAVTSIASSVYGDKQLWAKWVRLYTAKFSVNGNIDENNNRVVAEGEAITFPTDPEDIEGKKFQGWMVGTIDGTTNVKPELISSDKMGTDNVTYYAVFAADNGFVESSTTFKRVTNLSSLTGATKIVITNDGNNCISLNDAGTAIQNRSVTESNNQITPNAKSIWSLSGDNTNGYTFTQGTKTLGAASIPSSGNTAVSLTSSNNTWIFAAHNTTNCFIASNGSSKVYLEYYSNSWVIYPVANNANTNSYLKLRLYVPELESSYSDFCTTVMPTLAVPTGLAVSNLSTTSATLSWTAVDNAANYTVKIGETEYENITETSYAATELTAATEYAWTVKANAEGYNSSAYATAVNFTTDEVVVTRYDIAVTQPEHATIAADFAEAAEGVEVTLSYSDVAEHYHFVVWTVLNGETPVAVMDNKFAMPAGDVTVTATFAEDAKHDAIFSVNGATTNVTYYEGEAIAFTDPDAALIPEDVVFKGWAAAAIVGTQADAPEYVTEATMGNENVTYFAVFATESADGEYGGSGSKSFSYSDFTASGDGWTCTKNPITVAQAKGNVANSNTYVTLTENNYLTISCAPGYKINEIDFTTSNADYTGNLKDVTGLSTTSWQLKVDNPGNKTTCRMNSVKVTYTADITCSDYCTAVKAVTDVAIKTDPTTADYCEGEKFNPEGLEVTLTYEGGATKDVTYAGNEGKFTFAPALDAALTTSDDHVAITINGQTVNCTISVRSVKIIAPVVEEGSYTVKVGDAEAVTADGNDINALKGQKIVLASTPATGYKPASTPFVVKDEDDANVSISTAGGQYSFTMPDKDVTITAKFSKLYTLTAATTIANGSIAIKDKDNNVITEHVNNGKVVVVVTSAPHYTLSSLYYVKEGEESQTAIAETEGVYSFTMPQSNVTIYATFTEDEKHDAIFYVNGSESSRATTYTGEKVVFPTTKPEAPSTCAEKVFVGWTETSEYDDEKNAPTYVSDYTMANADKIFYAVFAEEVGDPTSFIKGSVSNLGTGIKVLLVHNDKAVSSSASKDNYLGAGNVTINNSKINCSDESLIWTVTKNESTYKFDQGASKILNVNASGLYANTTDGSFVISVKNSSYELKDANVTAYIDYWGADGFSKLAISHNDNTIDFYVPDVTYVNYSTICSECQNAIMITKGAETNGTFTLSKEGEVCLDKKPEGYSVTVKATPAEHYHLASVTTTSGVAGEIADNQCVVSGITANTTITAVFAEDTKYTVNWEVNGLVVKTENLYADVAVSAPAVEAINGKVFRGWVAEKIEGTIPNAADVDFVDVADKTISNLGVSEEETTYYAVFATKAAGADASVEFSVSSITSIQQTIAEREQTTDDGITFTFSLVGTTGTGNATVQMSKSSTLTQNIAFAGNIKSIKFEGFAYSSTKDASMLVEGKKGTDGTYSTVQSCGSTYNGSDISFNGKNYDFFKITVGSERTVKFTKMTVSYEGVGYSDFCTAVAIEPIIGTGGWSTFCRDFNYTVGNGTAFIATEVNISEGVIVLTPLNEGTVIPAGAGIAIQAEENANYTITPSADEAADLTDNQFVGTIVRTPKDPRYDWYAISTFGEVTGFARIGSGVTYLPAGKAFLKVDNGQAAPARFGLTIINRPNDPIATGVEQTTSSEGKKMLINNRLVIVRGNKMFDANGRLLK